MNQITVRQIPDDLDRVLKSYAKKMRMSLNKTVIQLLKKSLGLKDGRKKFRDLSGISRKWKNDEYKEFANSVRVFEQIDQDVWES